jgi:hypothetical protein
MERIVKVSMLPSPDSFQDPASRTFAVGESGRDVHVPMLEFQTDGINPGIDSRFARINP